MTTEPNSEDRRAHLSMIQSAVTRMASSSANAKTWLLPVVTAAYGYAFVRHADSIAMLGLLAVVVFAALDAHYLRMERAFRALYREAVAGRAGDFQMDASRFFGRGNGDEDDVRELNCRWSRVIWSWSVAGFYFPLLATGIVAAVWISFIS